jgi:hypothetical protein
VGVVRILDCGLSAFSIFSFIFSFSFFFSQKMMHAKSPPAVRKDHMLLFSLSAQAGPQFILSVTENGTVIVQPKFGNLCHMKEMDPAELEQDVFSKLPCNDFLALGKYDFETVPSNKSCGTAANLFLKTGGGMKWYGCWNYGRGGMKNGVADAMYGACLKLSKELSKRDDFKEVSLKDVRAIMDYKEMSPCSGEKYGECQEYN